MEEEKKGNGAVSKNRVAEIMNQAGFPPSEEAEKKFDEAGAKDETADVEKTVRQQIAEFIPVLDQSIATLNHEAGGIMMTMFAITLTLQSGTVMLTDGNRVPEYDVIKADYVENPVSKAYASMLKEAVDKLKKLRADLITKLGSI